MININDKNYPALLKELHKPPKLFYRGDIKILSKPCIAVVGTRFYSDYGQYMTEKLVRELSSIDVAIVSGLARGIDTIAHKTALECGLSTIAVLGSGLDNIYPAENGKLAAQIEKNGLLLSEFEDDMPPHKMNFPQRNRIISGLSIATVVIEAPDRSGALITADFAIDQNRELFVVPGDVDRPSSMGILKLLQKSTGYPVSSGLEIIEILRTQPHLIKERESPPPPPRPKINYNLSPGETKIFQIITKRGTTIEKIVKDSQLPINIVLSSLSLLEVKKLVSLDHGKYKLHTKNTHYA